MDVKQSSEDQQIMVQEQVKIEDLPLEKKLEFAKKI